MTAHRISVLSMILIPSRLRSKSASPESDASSYSAVKLECKRAFDALRLPNHTKSLRLLKEVCLCNEGSAFLHRIHGTVRVKFDQFYANLLYEASNDGKSYEEVVQECERGESQQKLSTTEAQITNFQQDLRSLIQKANMEVLDVLPLQRGLHTLRITHAHVERKNMENLSPKLQSVLPPEIDTMKYYKREE
ncbi:hypothetical protein NE237_032310 [Protea cynaroides]|uniref:Uncharacterized protein n=1 Tax=Protea cynaroides TaxID=273540 RepID=A0A9Q0L2V0_9MAGN|nr:hypothetical protein NE237_032310 [Protea cynaroides]